MTGTKSLAALALLAGTAWLGVGPGEARAQFEVVGGGDLTARPFKENRLIRPGRFNNMIATRPSTSSFFKGPSRGGLFNRGTKMAVPKSPLFQPTAVDNGMPKRWFRPWQRLTNPLRKLKSPDS